MILRGLPIFPRCLMWEEFLVRLFLDSYDTKKKCYFLRLTTKFWVASKLKYLFEGGIVAGLFSDFSGMRATTCVIMLVISAPIVCSVYTSLPSHWILTGNSCKCCLYIDLNLFLFQLYIYNLYGSLSIGHSIGKYTSLLHNYKYSY